MGGISGIKAVIFDMDDTLFPSTEFSERARRNASRAMVEAGLAATPEKVFIELAKIVAKKGSNYEHHFDDLCKKFGCPDRDRVVAAGIVAYHNTKASIQPFPETVRTLLTLRDAGYVLAVASEGQAVKQWDKLIRLGLDHMFHHVFVTNAKCAGKNKAFYAKIAKSLRIPASQMLMVGNNPSKDIAPANQAGFRTARIRVGRWTREKCGADLDIARLDGLLSAL